MSLRVLKRFEAEGIELPNRWLVTGVAGFVGCHLLETLLTAGCSVVGLDNFVTGKQENLDDVATRVTEGQWSRFRMVRGDVRDESTCCDALQGVQVVAHQAALGSVPRSMEQPNEVLDVNTLGSVTLFRAAAESGVQRCVYASSSSVYGNASDAVRRESVLGNPMSPYAVSKRSMEQLALIYQSRTRLETVGLRYFNVFGPRQNPLGRYSAVIPRWIRVLLEGATPQIHGSGNQTRDFTHVHNVVLANLLAASLPAAVPVVNVGTGTSTSILKLFGLIRVYLGEYTGNVNLQYIEPELTPPRSGDIAGAVADLGLAERALSYRPVVALPDGLRETVTWFVTSGRHNV